LHSKGGVAVSALSTRKLSLDAGKRATVDLDVFIRSDSGFPYIIPDPKTKSRARVALKVDDSAGAHAAGLNAGIGSWQYWDGAQFAESGVRIAYDVWNHVQIAVDGSTGATQFVVQPVGELPTLVGKGRGSAGAKVADGVTFSIDPSKEVGHLSCYDNVQIAAGPVVGK
jgi:hypothetical protein